jgi:hypothetical protein
VRGYPGWFFFSVRVKSSAFLAALAECHTLGTAILGMTPFGRATYAIGATRRRLLRHPRQGHQAVDHTAAFSRPRGLRRVARHHQFLTWEPASNLDVITGVVLGGIRSWRQGTIVGTALGLILIQASKTACRCRREGDGTIVVIGWY